MYNQIFQLQAETFKALAQARRLEIVNLLRDGELSVTEIHQMLDLPQANISQHLAVLKEAHILKSRKNGKHIFYSLASIHIITIIDILRTMLTEKYQDSEFADALTLNLPDLVPLTHDPVCKMRLSPKTAAFTHQHQSQTYYFCASGCLKLFKESPSTYVPN